MKKFFLLLCLISFQTVLYSQNEVHYWGKPDEVTVYQSSCIMSSSMKVNLKKGTNYIFIDSVAYSIDPNSIKVSIEGKNSVMSTDYKLENIKTENLKLPDELVKMEDSLKKLNFMKRDYNNQIEVLKGESEVINVYKIEKFDEKSGKLSDLQALAAYYAKRMNEIKKEWLNLSKKIEDIDSLAFKFMQDVAKYRQSVKPPVNYQIIAVVSAENEGTYDLNLNYLTQNAFWVPVYDIRAKDTDSPIKLVYKATVWQNTGRNWENVKLNLSTRNPNMSNILPILNPWFLRIFENNVDYDSPLMPAYSTSSNVRGSRSQDTQIRVDGIDIGTMTSSYFSVEYSPNQRYTIKSNNEQQSITLNEEEIKADYEYFTVPKLDPDAFLTAKISNWGDLKLLQGEASIYFDNSFVGKTTINPQQAQDTMILSLGRDKQIVIQRKQISEYTTTKFLSSNVERTMGYETTIRNNRKKNVRINLSDQVPVSTHEDIEVEILESSSGKLNKDTGEMKWLLDIPANSTKTVKLIFKVDLPKNVKM